MYPEALKDLDFNNKKSRATVAPLALSGDTRPAGERESKDLEYRRRAVMLYVRYISQHRAGAKEQYYRVITSHHITINVTSHQLIYEGQHLGPKLTPS